MRFRDIFLLTWLSSRLNLYLASNDLVSFSDTSSSTTPPSPEPLSNFEPQFQLFWKTQNGKDDEPLKPV